MLPPVRTLLRLLLWTILLVGLVVGIARAVAVRWFWLPTDDPVFHTSILPTLSPGDLILVQRITRPDFGDLVVCPEPGYPERYVIGRIAGLPGDEVELKDGVPLVNGKSFVQERSCDPHVFSYPNPNNEAEEIEQHCGWEAMANHLHMMGNPRGHQVPLSNNRFDVAEGTFFLLSDNRLFPYDSRDFGLVDISSCRETVLARLVSRQGWMDSENRLDYIQ